MRAAADQGFTTATAVADALVGRGLAFRSAHHVVGALVAAAEARSVGLSAVTDEEVASALAAVDDEAAAPLATAAGHGVGDLVRSAASVEGALAAAAVIGGTAPSRVRTALAAARERLGPG
jgi:argininosuccinate lyase